MQLLKALLELHLLEYLTHIEISQNNADYDEDDEDEPTLPLTRGQTNHGLKLWRSSEQVDQNLEHGKDCKLQLASPLRASCSLPRQYRGKPLSITFFRVVFGIFFGPGILLVKELILGIHSSSTSWIFRVIS